MARFLRLRHQLVPYLYTAAWVAHSDGVGLARPMYHDHPQAPEAYDVPNQYLFGPDLLVAPITTPAHRQTHLAEVTAWLPEGAWFDFLTGRRYDGGRSLVLHRTLEQMPVFARAGAVIPLLPDPMDDVVHSPDALTLRVFPAASGTCVLYEDDGRGSPIVADRQETAVSLSWTDRGDGAADVALTVAPPTGPGVRTVRSLTLELVGAASVERAVLRGAAEREIAAVPPSAGASTPLVAGLRFDLGLLDLAQGAEVAVTGVRLRPGDVVETAFALLDMAEIAFDTKEQAFRAVSTLSGTALVGALHALHLPGNLYGALVELVSAG